MAYKHGVYTSEAATSIISPVNTAAGLPVIYGTAPVHLASDRAEVNKPILCHTYAEALAAFGYSDNWRNFTLCEAIYSYFTLYGVAPVVLVNVLDPKKHIEKVSAEEKTITEGTVVLSDPVLPETLEVRSSSAGEPLTAGTDYEAAFDDDGNLVITALKNGALSGSASLYATYTKLDPSAVEADDIIGGIDVSTGKEKGMETIGQVFTLFGLVPGILLAPGWSEDPSVASVMKAKASDINGFFNAVCLVDIPADTVTKYSDVYNWKNQNNYTGANMAACWPMVRNGDHIFHMSTHLAGVIGKVDADNDDVPFESPSNKSMQATGLCLKDGSEVVLTIDQANYLNGEGIITGLNFMGGWVIWGNRTAAYPANTDVKDCFLCVRRMFNWHAQTFIQTYWQKVDKPINKRLIQTVVDSENIRLNGLVASGALLGGRIEFLEEENPTTDLLDGIIRFHTYITPPTPAREIENVIEYDPSYFSTLFE